MTFATGLRCVHCGDRFPLEPLHEGCPSCRSDGFAAGLTPVYDYAAIAASLADAPLAEPGAGIWRYRRLLPVADPADELSLGEGGTALVPLPRLAAELRAAEVWLKDEARNPTLSFKDRNAAVIVSKALDFGAGTILVSTSGNHGVAVAAYAARVGLRCVVLTYPGIPLSPRVLMQAYGAQVAITTAEGRWAIMRAAVREHGWFPASNFNDVPTNTAYGHEGYKTIAYELHQQLGDRGPDLVAIPTAYAEGLYGIGKGFDELVRLGLANRAPRLLACEPAGGPLGRAFERGDGSIASVAPYETVARGIGATTNSYLGLAALAASDGLVGSAADPEILRAQRDLAAEGLAVEPASATALAGLRAIARRGELPPGLRIVLVSTSSGLKNLDSLAAAYPEPPTVEPTFDALEAALDRDNPSSREAAR